MMVGPNEVVPGDHDKAGFNGVMGVTVAQKWSQYVVQREIGGNECVKHFQRVLL